MKKKIQKIVVGITGASGALYVKQLLHFLKNHTEHDVSVVASDNGRTIFYQELGLHLDKMGYSIFNQRDFSAPFVSGSASYDQMVILPCSMGALARIANGISDDVLTRAADVFLKEKRPLIIVPRETPLSLIHIENMKKLALAGATLINSSPSFYSRPQTMEELAYTVVARVLDHLHIEHSLIKRWGEIDS